MRAYVALEGHHRRGVARARSPGLLTCVYKSGLLSFFNVFFLPEHSHRRNYNTYINKHLNHNNEATPPL